MDGLSNYNDPRNLDQRNYGGHYKNNNKETKIHNNALNPEKELAQFRTLENKFKAATTDKERRVILSERTQQAMKMHGSKAIMDAVYINNPKIASSIKKIATIQVNNEKKKQQQKAKQQEIGDD